MYICRNCGKHYSTHYVVEKCYKVVKIGNYTAQIIRFRRHALVNV